MPASAIQGLAATRDEGSGGRLLEEGGGEPPSAFRQRGGVYAIDLAFVMASRASWGVIRTVV
jgi:hypothetical protein